MHKISLSFIKKFLYFTLFTYFTLCKQLIKPSKIKNVNKLFLVNIFYINICKENMFYNMYIHGVNN